MSINLKKAAAAIKKGLGEWSSLTFEEKWDDGSVTFVASGVSLKEHDDDISICIDAYESGSIVFRAVFDKLSKTPKVLEYLNAFNEEDIFFRATVTGNGYLDLRHFFLCFDEDVLADYSSILLSRLIDASKRPVMKLLTAITD